MSGFAVWLTGLPASGKSALAQEVARQLAREDIGLQILDSDDLRQVITPQPTYSEEERDWFYGVMAYIGKLLTQNDVNVAFAATAAKQNYRDQARQMIENFIEVYVQCSLDTCMKRDPKGLYERARSGEIDNLPGFQTNYEAPAAPEIIVNTDTLSVKQGARRIIEGLNERRFRSMYAEP